MKIQKSNLAIYFILVTIISLLSSCGINSDLMFKTPKKNSLEEINLNSSSYKLYNKDSIPLYPVQDYTLSKDDKFTISLATNDGQIIIQSLSGTSENTTTNQIYAKIEYVIRRDGYVNLPVVGDVQLIGKTVKQAEDELKRLYGEFYINPFVQLIVTNRRVIVFPGDGGDAQVIYLTNNNTTLMEVIAAAGGIAQRGKARQIKLIRSVSGTREIYPIDLSNLEGLKFADMVVQSNDYVYIEPNPRIGREIINQTAPFLAIFSSLLLIYNIFKK